MPIPRIKTTKAIVPSEDNECMALANYLRLKGLRFSHIAQETPAGSYQFGVWKPAYKTLKRNKEMGVNQGVPDYIVIIERKGTEKAGPRNNILLFIEMKRELGGKVSTEQSEWINALNKVFGVVAVVCCGFEEAKNFIDAYVK